MRYLLEKENTKEKVIKGHIYQEPVNELVGELKANTSKRIILTGNKGSGKSTILYQMEKEGITTYNPSIISYFDSVGITLGECDKEELYTHMYELEMSNNILNYINKYYRDIYYDHFKDLHRLIKSLITELNIYIRNIGFQNVKINRMYKNGELTEKIVKTFKKSLESLTLIIDKFDSIDNGSELSQRKLSNYFDLFDKIIIVGEDKTIKSERKQELNNKGYQIINVEYGTNINNIKGILFPIIGKYNISLIKDDIPFPLENLTDELLTKVSNMTKGNIDIILKSVANTHVLASWKDVTFNFEETLLREVKRQLDIRLELDNMSPKKVLHL